MEILPFQNYLQVEFFKNTVFHYIEFFVIAIVLWFFLFLFQLYKRKNLKNSFVLDAAIEAFQSFSLWWYGAISVSLASFVLLLHPYIRDGFFIILAFSGILFLQKLFYFYLESTQEKSQRKDVALTGVKIFINLLIWISGVLLILSNLGVQITALITSLGVVGIAVAFALQNILADIFSSFSIFFDKPFQYGDLISIGGEMGTVKKIGIKTTRIQTSRGEELIVPNKDLTNSRILNFRRMEKRRGLFTLSIDSKTPLSLLKQVPSLIKACITPIQHVQFDRAHFKSFGDTGLVFEVVYYVDSNDYMVYMDAQQNVNFAIQECFEKEKISLTSTVVVVGNQAAT